MNTKTKATWSINKATVFDVGTFNKEKVYNRKLYKKVNNWSKKAKIKNNRERNKIYANTWEMRK